MNDLWGLSFPYWKFALRAGVVYFAILILLRIGGKRQVGQMGVGEFIAILLISNAVQNSMNGGDNSITGGLILAAVIIVLSYLVSYATFKSKKIENLVQGRPTLLVHDGKILEHNLDKELLSNRELRALLRRQGVHDLRDIHAAILESDGFISVTKNNDVSNHRPESDSTPRTGAPS